MENTKEKILLTGGSGRLGQLLIPLLEEDHEVVAPSHTDFGITWSVDSMREELTNIKPTIVVHCAAITNPMQVHESADNYNAGRSIATNIVGTANLAICCEEQVCKLVYISTDYVYPGDRLAPRDGWAESDPVGPVNNYGRSKLGGELAVQMIEDHLILRCSFTPRPFKHQNALIESVKSPMYIDHAAAVISKMILYEAKGIINIGGTEKCSLYEWALQQGLTVGREHASNLPYKVPNDTSLNIDRMQSRLKLGVASSGR